MLLSFLFFASVCYFAFFIAKFMWMNIASLVFLIRQKIWPLISACINLFVNMWQLVNNILSLTLYRDPKFQIRVFETCSRLVEECFLGWNAYNENIVICKIYLLLIIHFV